jgi:hypothetical protein
LLWRLCKLIDWLIGRSCSELQLLRLLNWLLNWLKGSGNSWWRFGDQLGFVLLFSNSQLFHCPLGLEPDTFLRLNPPLSELFGFLTKLRNLEDFQCFLSDGSVVSVSCCQSRLVCLFTVALLPAFHVVLHVAVVRSVVGSQVVVVGTWRGCASVKRLLRHPDHGAWRGIWESKIVRIVKALWLLMMGANSGNGSAAQSHNTTRNNGGRTRFAGGAEISGGVADLITCNARAVAGEHPDQTFLLWVSAPRVLSNATQVQTKLFPSTPQTQTLSISLLPPTSSNPRESLLPASPASSYPLLCPHLIPTSTIIWIAHQNTFNRTRRARP